MSDPQADTSIEQSVQSEETLAAETSIASTVAVDDTATQVSAGKSAAAELAQNQDIIGAIAEYVKLGEISPGDREIWEQLTILYRQQGQVTEAAHALHKVVSLHPVGADRDAALLEYATLLTNELHDHAGAVATLQSVVHSDPASVPAMHLLAGGLIHAEDLEVRKTANGLLGDCYRAGGHFNELSQLLTQQLDQQTDLIMQAAILKELAEIKLKHLQDAVGGYADLERAFGLSPADTELRERLEIAAAAAGTWEQLVVAYQTALTAGLDEEVQAVLHQRLAWVLDTHLGRGEEALNHYQSGDNQHIPSDPEALASMRNLLLPNGPSKQLAEVLTAMVRLTEEETTKFSLLVELADVYEQLKDDEHALSTLVGAREIKDRNAAVLRRMVGIFQRLEKQDRLRDVLEVLVEVEEDNETQLADRVLLADLYVSGVRYDDAFKVYRAVLQKKRGHEGAVTGLQKLIEVSEDKAEIAQVLEPIYTAKQNHAQLAWVLRQRLIGTEELSERKALLRRIGDIYENRLQNLEDAFGMARQSMSEDPSDMGVRMWLEKLAGELGAHDKLASVYVEQADVASDDLKVQFHRRAADLYHNTLEQAELAIGQYRHILALDDRDEKALTGLEKIFRSSGAAADLVELLEKRCQLTAGTERKRQYLTEIGALLADQLTDYTAASHAYKRLLEIAPDDTDSFTALVKLLEKSDNWDALLETYAYEEARLADKRGGDVQQRKRDLTLSRARVLADHFSDTLAAAELCKEVLQEDPDNDAVLQYLEGQSRDAGVIDYFELLENIYREQNQWQPLVESLEGRLGHTAENALRRGILLRMAEVYDDHLEAGDLAFQYVAHAVNENRADLELLNKLHEVAKKHSKWMEFVQILGTDVDAIPDPEVRQISLRKLGVVCGVELDNRDYAVAYLQRALQYQPSDQEALAAIDTLYERYEMWAELGEILERRIELCDDQEEKQAFEGRLADLFLGRLGNPEAAIRCHQRVLAVSPHHPDSLKSMETLYRGIENWDELAKNLALQLEVLEAPEEQARIHAAAGELYTEELEEMEVAIGHWQEVVAFDPTHELAVQALDVLLPAEERWEEFADHLRRKLSSTKDPAAKMEINSRLGLILHEKLGRDDDALTSWESVLATDEKNVEAMRALLDLYSEHAQWTDFVGVAKRMIPLTDPAEAKDVRFRLAQALGENLGKIDEAIQLAREVRALEPHTDEQMFRLGTMLCNIESYDEAVLALEKGAALVVDPVIRVTRYKEVVDIYRDQLDSENDAADALAAILRDAEDDLGAYLQLCHIYRETEQWRKLVGLHEQCIPHVPREDRVAILCEIRDVQYERLGDKEMAFIAACRVFNEDPSNLDAAQVIEKIAIDTDAAEEAAAVLEDEIDGIDNDVVKVELCVQVARIYSEELRDLLSSEQVLRKLLAVDPAYIDAYDSLAEVAAKEGRFDKQVEVWEEKLAQLEDETERKSVLYDIAHAWEERLGSMPQAVASYNRILEMDGLDHASLDSLARIYQVTAHWTELAHVLTRKVELTQDADENVALRMRVAQLCESELADLDAAIQWYTGVLEYEDSAEPALNSLERLYTGLERWSELITIFQQKLQLTEGADDKILLLAKMASLYEAEFDSTAEAVKCYEQCYEIDNTHIPTLCNLERLLKILGEWERLITIFEHHLELLGEPSEVAGLLIEIGEIYYQQLSRVDKAEQIYIRAKETDPTCSAALHALGLLYERSGNWWESLAMMQAEADVAGMDESALPVLMRIGRINADMMMDMGAAKLAYENALSIDPSYPPALDAMKDIAYSNHDWDTYSEYLLTLAETSDDEEERTDLFIELAEFYANQNEDDMSAIRFYGRALEITPEHIETCSPLADIYFRNEMWSEAGEQYRVVVAVLDKAVEATDYCQKQYRLAYISEKEGDAAAALLHYREAFEADATYLPALEGLAQSLLNVEEWEEAQKVFQTILIHHREALTESEVVDVQGQLGDIFLAQGMPDRAKQQYEKALAIDPDHPQSLSALAKLAKESQAWERAYKYLNRLGDVAPGNERLDALMQMSEIATHQLADSERALEPLERARRHGVASFDSLMALADLYIGISQAAKAADVMQQAVDCSADPEQRSNASFDLAEIFEIHIKHEPLAVQKYSEALDAQATNFKAFEAIERILGGRQEWVLLEENYRAQIARSQGLSNQVKLVLWRNLAELYRRVLVDLQAARQAYGIIVKMLPDSVEDRMALAEIESEIPEYQDNAITIYHELATKSDNPVPMLKALRRIYHAKENFDAVFVTSSLLVFLNSADDEEKQVYEYLSRAVPPRAEGAMVEDHWQVVRYPGLECPIGSLATELFRLGRESFLQPPKSFGFKKKELIDTRASDLLFANLIRYASKLLGAAPMDLYRKAKSMQPLQLVPTQPVSLAIGADHDLMRDASQTRLSLFYIGSNIAYARGEMALARMFQGDGFRNLLLGACVLFNRQMVHDGHPTEVEKWADKLQRLPQATLQRLQPLVIAAHNDLLSAQKFVSYLQAVEHTAIRAGMIAAGDLSTAHRAIGLGTNGVIHMDNNELIKQLVIFNGSKEYLRLRPAIGAQLVLQ